VNDELRERLLALSAEDQEFSRAVFEASERNESHRGRFLFDIPRDEWLPEYFEPPEKAAARMEALRDAIRAYGWPGESLVGEDGCRAAWTIAQHGGDDPALQRECERALADAVVKGEAKAGQLAALRDRIELEAGRVQLYGTHLEPLGDSWRPVRGVDDPAAVDRRRGELGLKVWSDYLADCLAGRPEV
jgi:hypothetical protein